MRLYFANKSENWDGTDFQMGVVTRCSDYSEWTKWSVRGSLGFLFQRKKRNEEKERERKKEWMKNEWRINEEKMKKTRTAHTFGWLSLACKNTSLQSDTNWKISSLLRHMHVEPRKIRKLGATIPLEANLFFSTRTIQTLKKNISRIVIINNFGHILTHSWYGLKSLKSSAMVQWCWDSIQLKFEALWSQNFKK